VTAGLRPLTVRQSWASAIAYGGKRVENRSWPAPPWLTGLAVHAGSGIDWDAPPEAWTAAGLAPYRRGARRANWTASLPLGAVIAVAELAGCHHSDDCGHCSAWSEPGSWHWELRDVRPLRAPVPCRGKLGLWRLPEHAEKGVREQLEDSRA